MSLLYHYTTIDAAIQIVKYRCLFSSQVRYLNDSSEFIFAKKFASTAVKRRAKEEWHHVKPAEGVELEFDGSEHLIQSLTEPLEKLSPLYVTCFTQPSSLYAQQNGVLSLWRGYGSRGVALVFDRDALWRQMDEERRVFSYNNIWMEPVKYVDPSGENMPPETADLISKIADLVPWALSSQQKVTEYSYPADRVKVQPADRLEEVVRLFAFTKHGSFAEESEYRVVAAPIVRLYSEAKAKKSIKFRYSNGAVVPYIHLPLGEGTDFALREILVGPSTHQDRLVASLIEYARLAELSVSVRASDIPYVAV